MQRRSPQSAIDWLHCWRPSRRLMSHPINPQELAERVRALVAREDGGDVAQAAARIGVRERDLAAVLEASDEQPKLTLLSAIVRGYDVDAWWLITGEAAIGSSMSAEQRVDSINLLSELGEAMTLQRRLSAADGSSEPSAERLRP